MSQSPETSPATPAEDPPKTTAPSSVDHDSDAALDPLRSQIDELDRRIIELLNRRAQVVVDIGKMKRDGQWPIYAPDREQQVLERVRRNNRGPLPDSCIEAIWRELMSGSFTLERALRVGYLGPPGSYSHLAARRQFGACVEYTNMETIRDVFDQTARGQTDLGLVPIENSTHGGIGETLDCFIDMPVKICAEVLNRVHHNLLAKCPPDRIERVYSKPEALNQCQHWLGTRLQQAERIPVASTSKAAEQAASEPGAAAIGSSVAAQIYDLKVLFEKIEDSPSNVTRFFVIAKDDARPTSDDKTAIMFITAHESGALANMLDVFRQYSLNLTHIDKRPSRNVNWEYYFFIDFEGHNQDANVARAIEAARSRCHRLTVLGSFPRACQEL